MKRGKRGRDTSNPNVSTQQQQGCQFEAVEMADTLTKVFEYLPAENKSALRCASATMAARFDHTVYLENAPSAEVGTFDLLPPLDPNQVTKAELKKRKDQLAKWRGPGDWKYFPIAPAQVGVWNMMRSIRHHLYSVMIDGEPNLGAAVKEATDCYKDAYRRWVSEAPRHEVLSEHSSLSISETMMRNSDDLNDPFSTRCECDLDSWESTLQRIRSSDATSSRIFIVTHSHDTPIRHALRVAPVFLRASRGTHYRHLDLKEVLIQEAGALACYNWCMDSEDNPTRFHRVVPLSTSVVRRDFSTEAYGADSFVPLPSITPIDWLSRRELTRLVVHQISTQSRGAKRVVLTFSSCMAWRDSLDVEGSLEDCTSIVTTLQQQYGMDCFILLGVQAGELERLECLRDTHLPQVLNIK